MDAEKREARVRDRIDQAGDEVARGRLQSVVVAAERDDPRHVRPAIAAHRRDPVGLETCAGDHMAGLEIAGGSSTTTTPSGALGQTGDGPSGVDRAALVPDLLSDRQGHRPEVDDPGPWRPQAADPGRLRFQLADPVGPDDLEPRRRRWPRPARGALQAGKLRLGQRDDELARVPERDRVGLGEALDLVLALRAQRGLERARGVVQAGVEDPAVVARLMASQLRLLLDDGQTQPGPFTEQAVEPSRGRRSRRRSPRRQAGRCSRARHLAIGRIEISVTSAVRGQRHRRRRRSLPRPPAGASVPGGSGLPSQPWIIACRGVAVRPGKTVVTRIPSGFTSSRSDVARARRPACVAAYWPALARATRAALELTKTIWPCARRRLGRSPLVSANGARRFASYWRSKSSTLASATSPRGDRPGRVDQQVQAGSGGRRSPRSAGPSARRRAGPSPGLRQSRPARAPRGPRCRAVPGVGPPAEGPCPGRPGRARSPARSPGCRR